jgi:hypothetical protein
MFWKNRIFFQGSKMVNGEVNGKVIEVNGFFGERLGE